MSQKNIRTLLDLTQLALGQLHIVQEQLMDMLNDQGKQIAENFHEDVKGHIKSIRDKVS